MLKEEPKTAASNSSSSSKAALTLSQYPVRYIRGVGPRLAEVLAEKGIHSTEDLLDFFPNKYLDRRHLSKISELQPGSNQVTAGKILTCGIAFAGRRRIFEILLGDDSGVISLKFFRFHPRHMMGAFKKGMGLIVSGDATLFRNQIQFIHPTMQKMDGEVVEEIAAPGIVPVYPEIEGVGQKTLRKILTNGLELFADKIPDPLPPEILLRRAFPKKSISYRQIHFPDPEIGVDELQNLKTPAFQREIFEEFFLMELGLALKRRQAHREAGVAFSFSEEKTAEWYEQLPFQLTGAQGRALKEIFKDLSAPHPMNRLLQGDVGSGKTVVAFLAALAAIENGFQVALMAPTEILAEQHYLSARKLLSPFQIPVALLTSRLDASEKRRAHARIGKGMFPLVIGTHALIQEKVIFQSLGLVIIDEQHRFGVMQRAALKEKGKNPHILVMTATPIPRTLAMTIYGDLDLSVIDELPPGRQRIQTQVLDARHRRLLYSTIRETLERGEQGYVVYPLIEESEKLPLKDATQMCEELKRELPGFTVGLLHGRTPPEEKEAVMRSFKAGDIHLLVSTTVIEVGIDVPNATLIVIEHAERFGLSQLHQLRGRVGRGAKASQCLLVATAVKGMPSFDRLRVMTTCHDGFQIAEEDLKIRGPGEFLGTRQSGLPELKIGNLVRDYRVLEAAREEAFRWLDRDPELKIHPPLKEALWRKWGTKFSLADVG